MSDHDVRAGAETADHICLDGSRPGAAEPAVSRDNGSSPGTAAAADVPADGSAHLETDDVDARHAGEADWELAASVRELFLAPYGGLTLKSYRSDLRDFWRYADRLGIAPLAFTRAGLEGYSKHLMQARRLRPSTCARRLSVLAGCYTFAVDEGAIPTDPMARVRRPRVPPDSPVPGLDREQLRLLLNGAEQHSPRAHALIALLINNGFRVSEALGLDITDLLKVKGMTVVRIVRKGGKAQLAPLAETTAMPLRTYLDGRQAGPVFLSKSGRRLAPEAANELLRAVGHLVLSPEEANALRCHRLRHGWVSGCLDNNVPLVEVQQAAGHRSPTTTARYDRARAEVSREHPTFLIAGWLNGPGQDR